MTTLTRTFLPDQLKLHGKIYTRHQPNNKYSLRDQAQILEGAKIPVILLNVLARNLRGRENIHGKPYQPTQWLYVHLKPDGKAK